MSLKNFIKYNKRIIFKKNKKKYFLIIDRGRVINTLFQSIYGGVINKKYNCDAKVILTNPNYMHQIFKSFGDVQFYKSSIFGSIKNIYFSIKGFFFVLKNFTIIKKRNLDWFINNFKIADINVGDLIYDTNIRYNHKYIDHKKDLKFFATILTTYVKVNLINDILKKNKIKYILMGQQCYATIGAIALRMGIKYKIKTLEPNNDFLCRQFFIEYNKNKIDFGPYNFFYRYLKNDKKLLSRLKFKNKEFDNFFYKRCLGKIKLGYSGEVDLMNANQNPNLKINRKKLLKRFDMSENRIKKIIVVAFHAFSDAPHGDGVDMIFTDYYAHAKETLNFLKTNYNKNTLYLIKPHPTRFLYNEHGLFENLFEKIINEEKNIKICPVDISTYSLIKLCDAVVTLKGTIAIEFASNGKHALTCSTTPYAKLNIINEAKTKKEYFKKIKQLSFVTKKLDYKKVIKAQKVLYLMEKNHPENYLGKSRIFDEEFLKSTRRAESIDMYFNKKFINKIKKGGFLTDKYIKNLEKII